MWFLIVIMGGGIALAAPVVPQDLEWMSSATGVKFDTQSGFLEEGFYALDETEDGFFVNHGDGVDLENLDYDLTGLKETQIIGNWSYHQFRDGDKIIGVETTKEDYDALGLTGAGKPTHKKRTSVIEARISEAAIGEGNISTTTEQTGVTSITFSHTVDTGSDRVLFVGHFGDDSTDDCRYHASTLPTFDGTNMATSSDEYESGADVMAGTSTLTAPNQTTANVVITLQGDGNCAEVVGFSMDLTGVDQTDPIDVIAGKSQVNTETFTQSFTTDATDSFGIDAIISTTNTTLSADGGQNNRHQVDVGGEVGGFSTKSFPTTGSNSMAWTGGGAANDWAGALIVYQEVQGAPAAPVTGSPQFIQSGSSFIKGSGFVH